jgi:hypothetical protein
MQRGETEAMLGRRAKDIITGFQGTVVGRVTYISGCDQALLQPEVKDGKFEEARWFDVQRVQVDESSLPIALDNSKTPGPDVPAPIR